MSKQQHDISQIRKYLDGELDAHAMHKLEREAQDDPFLMDALEGYEHAGTNRQKNLDELSARLQLRVEKKEAKVIPWRFLSMAASVLIVITIGGVLLLKKEQPVTKEQRVAQVVEPEDKISAEKNLTDTQQLQKQKYFAPPAAPVMATPPLMASHRRRIPKDTEQIALAPAGNSSNMISSEPPEAGSAAPSNDMLKKTNSVAMKEIVVNEYAANRAATDTLKKPVKANFYANTPVASIVPSHVPGVNVEPGNLRSAGNQTINGRITDTYNGEPIAGAIVKVNGAKFGVLSDADGKFVLPGVPANATLDATFIGYSSKKINVGANDSVNIALSPNNQSLAEAIVTRGKSDRSPRPKDGWPALKRYLDANATLTDGSTGEVKLTFTVDSLGNLSDFQITKSLSADADEKAINLIKNGPTWVGDSKPQKVKVTVDFH